MRYDIQRRHVWRNGKLSKEPVPVLHVVQSTGRGWGTQWLHADIPVDDLLKEIAKTPALRMQLLAALLVEEAKRAVQPA